MKVYVSYTPDDLQIYYVWVGQALLTMDAQPISRENFGARPGTLVDTIQETLQECDAFIGIYAYHLGEIPFGETQSITEIEFDLAKQNNLPCYCYRVEPGFPWVEERKDKGAARAQLRAFMEQVSSQVQVSTFNTPDDLAKKVSADLGRGFSRIQAQSNLPAPDITNRAREKQQSDLGAKNTPAENTANVSVGAGATTGNITVTQKISNLPWKWMLVLLALLLVLLFVIILIFRGVTSIGEILNPDPCPMPPGQFNVAIADFAQVDAAGQIHDWSWNEGIKKALANGIRNYLSANSELNRDLKLADKGIAPITTAEQLDKIIAQCRPTILMYGAAEKTTGATRFNPRFWVRDIKNAEELVGEQMLGTPLAIDDLHDYDAKANRELDARIRALVLFVHGLNQFDQEQYEYAVQDFQAATKIDGWVNGKEVAFLFYGTALKERNGEGDLVAARTAYSNALKINPGYERAHIGLGNVALAEFAADQTNNARLDEASHEYEIAKANASTLLIRAKAGMGLSGIYFVKAQLGQLDYSAKAKKELNEIIDAHAGGATELRTIIADVHRRLGQIQEWENPPDKTQAKKNYAQCAELADSDSKLKDICVKAQSSLEK